MAEDLLGHREGPPGLTMLHHLPAWKAVAMMLTLAAPGVPERPQPPDAELTAMLRQVRKAELQATVQKLVGFRTRHTSSTGIGPAVQWVLDTMKRHAAGSGGRMKVELQEFVVKAGSARVAADTTLRNVVATIRGSRSPDRLIVVSAHIDSRASDVMDATSDAPGADDDASGVAVVMELARLFSTHEPGATVVLTVVSGEEQKLYGSAFQASAYKASGADIEAMVTDDIVGSSTADDGTCDPHTLRVFSEEADGPSRELARFARSVAENELTQITLRHVHRRDRTLRSGDHASYQSQGYPALRFTEPAENYDHQHQNVRVEAGKQFGDLPAFLDFDYLARVARVNAAFAWSLAAAPAPPTGVILEAGTLSNTSTLRWTRGAGAAGYEVVWRETGEPDWTHVVAAGDVAIISFPHFSRDNVVFGVRAVDAAGHRSPAASPAIH